MSAEMDYVRSTLESQFLIIATRRDSRGKGGKMCLRTCGVVISFGFTDHILLSLYSAVSLATTDLRIILVSSRMEPEVSSRQPRRFLKSFGTKKDSPLSDFSWSVS